MIDPTRDETNDWRDSVFGRKDEAAVEGKSLEAEIPGSRNGTARSSWLRRMSTFGSSLSGSPVSTPRPSTPLVSFSHTSSAPILSTTATPILPRNKLVKRASSQRLLQSRYADYQLNSKTQVTTLRRPATSHQRSATLQHQYSQDEVEPSQDSYSIGHGVVHDGEDQPGDSLADVWYPFFRSRNSMPAKETLASKRDSIGSSGHADPIRRISAFPSELPTLLMANSICSTTPDEFMHPNTHVETPFTPVRSQTLPTPSTYSPLAQAQSADDQRHKPRSSFSLTDFFPSPSPSTWKMARSGSLRKKKGSEGAIHGRRIASAPQPSKGRRNKESISTEIDSGPQADHSDSLRGSLADAGLPFEASRMRSPSSPLPSLQRLSTFDIDLPDAVPSYPTSPRPTTTASMSFRTSPVPVMSANVPGHFSVRGKPHRPSGVSLDRASTLVGSDNENGRFSGGDGDELDCQSETVYDSIRTGATGSSHSGVRGPRIESVFDTSPPPELLKQNLAALQEKLSNGSVTSWGPNRDFIEEEEESLRTPMKFNDSLQDDLPTPPQGDSLIVSSPRLKFPNAQAALEVKRTEEDAYNFDGSQFDEGWAFNDVENHSWDNDGLGLIAGEEQYSTLSPALPSFTPADSPLSELTDHQDRPKPNIFEWSDRINGDRDSQQGPSPRPKTVHGKQNTERDGRPSGRRGPSALHLRSQSVPLPPDGLSHRGVNTTSKLDAWLLGSKGVSEEWDGDFEFEEPVQSVQPRSGVEDVENSGTSNVILVPQAILERQASVHGQFGQVKELTLLVEELKRLRLQASAQGIMGGQSAELWKEAEGIINLATLDDEDQDFLDPHSPRSPSFDYDPFEDDSPASQRYRRSSIGAPKEGLSAKKDHPSIVQTSSHSSPAGSHLGTPPTGRPRKESVAKAKSVLENIHQHRSSLDPPLADVKAPQKKLPFDTTSLRDLVTRAGVVTRALKEIVRKANDAPPTSDRPLVMPPDPPFSQIFHKQSNSPAAKKSPRVMKSTSSKTFLGGSIAGNDNDINGHMKMMTVV